MSTTTLISPTKKYEIPPTQRYKLLKILETLEGMTAEQRNAITSRGYLDDEIYVLVMRAVYDKLRRLEKARDLYKEHLAQIAKLTQEEAPWMLEKPVEVPPDFKYEYHMYLKNKREKS